MNSEYVLKPRLQDLVSKVYDGEGGREREGEIQGEGGYRGRGRGRDS